MAFSPEAAKSAILFLIWFCPESAVVWASTAQWHPKPCYAGFTRNRGFRYIERLRQRDNESIMLYNFLVVILVIDAVVLIAAILLQAGKGSGLAANFGGASSSPDAFIGIRQAGNLLTTATWWCAGIFLGLSFVLQVMSTRTQVPKSVLEDTFGSPPPASAPAPTSPSTAAPAVPLQAAPGTANPAATGTASPPPATTTTPPATKR